MFNLTSTESLEENYLLGLLPQRNSKNYFYKESSCRSNLKKYSLSSENRRIQKKMLPFKFQLINLADFDYTPSVQKQIYKWIKELGWDFPISSVKYIFTQHFFNRLYIWSNNENTIIGYALCLVTDNFSHIGYVFYDPLLKNSDFPIGIVLQFVSDSYLQHLDYAYLGRFDLNTKTGYYKRNLPGFEFFQDGNWVTYHQHHH